MQSRSTSVIRKILSTVLALLLLLLQGIRCPAMAQGDAITDSMVQISPRPDFSFRYDLYNEGSGERSPIVKEYYLSKYKVTNAQYKAFTDATGHKTPGYWKNGKYPLGKENHPVLNVSYSDAQAYCVWLSAQYDDWTFRLPTEAEWENAAMGSYYGNTAVKYPTNAAPSYNSATNQLQTDFNYNAVIASKLIADYGSDYIVNYIKGDYAGSSETLGECIQISKTGGVSNWANHGGNATKGYFLQTDLYAEISADGGYTTPVGSYRPNTLGLYDMAGNCWDITSSEIIAVNGLEAGATCYAVRGGSWYATGRSCTFYYRGEGRKDHPSATVGFRLAADRNENADCLHPTCGQDGKCSVCSQDLVTASIDVVTLRPGSTGIYFQGSFSINQQVAVSRYGIAISLYNRKPVADDSDTNCLWTSGNYSVLVSDIMDSTKTAGKNSKNSQKPIYARAYVLLEDGTYIYGNTEEISLQQLVTAVDSKWDTLTNTQKLATGNMYHTFQEVMVNWKLPNLKQATAIYA